MGQKIPSPVTRLTKGYANQKTYGTNHVDLVDYVNGNVIAGGIYEPYADEILAALNPPARTAKEEELLKALLWLHAGLGEPVDVGKVIAFATGARETV